MGEISDTIRRLVDAGTDLDTIITVVEAMENLKPKRKAAPAKGARLAADWALPDDWLQWALGEFPNMPRSYADAEAAKFKDYWISRGKPMVDWQATWRNWVRKAVDDRRAKQATRSPQSTTERRRADLAERMMADGYGQERERGADPQDGGRLHLARH